MQNYIEKLTIEVPYSTIKKIDDPQKKIKRYISIINIKHLLKWEEELTKEWININPREQKEKSKVSKEIYSSLKENDLFHVLNRGCLFSVEDLSINNIDKKIKIILKDYEIHGNIDGLHTLKQVFKYCKEYNKSIEILNKYITIEFIVLNEENLDFAIELAKSRNTSTEVDSKSIENLKNTYKPLIDKIKKYYPELFNNLSIKQFDNKSEDIRTIISLLNIFNKEIYKNNENFNSTYTSKEFQHKKFIKWIEENDKKEKDYLKNNIDKLWIKWKQILDFYEIIELKLADKEGLKKVNKKIKWGKFKWLSEKNQSLKTMINCKEIHYKWPRPIIWAIVSGFWFLEDKELFYSKQLLEKNWDSILKITIEMIERNKRNPILISRDTQSWNQFYLILKISWLEEKNNFIN